MVEELLEEGLAFQTRQMHAQAAVHAVPEADVLGDLAMYVEPVRLLETLRITVRRAVHQNDLVALGDRHIADPGRVGFGPPEGEMGDAVVSQHLLERRNDQAPVGPDAAVRDAVLRQRNPAAGLLRALIVPRTAEIDAL